MPVSPSDNPDPALSDTTVSKSGWFVLFVSFSLSASGVILVGTQSATLEMVLGIGLCLSGVFALSVQSFVKSRVTDMEQLQGREASLETKIERLEAVSDAKTEFLVKLSHNMRTPLTALLGYAELLSGTQQSEEKRQECVDTIRNSGQELLTILDDVIDLTKLQSGQLTVERIECNVGAVLQEVVEFFRVRAASKGLKLELNYANAIPRYILSDPARLRQTLVNLISNAIKFTDRGHVHVTAKFIEGTESVDPVLQVRVEDTGIGMAKSQLTEIFVGMDEGRSGAPNASPGLGLPICKRLAELLGGRLEVESTVGHGTTFGLQIEAPCPPHVEKVEVPSVSTYKRKKDERSRIATGSVATRKLRGRILLAEDGVDNQRLISFHLKRAGLQVDTAENGEVAFQKAMAAQATERPYRVILLDMQMPVCDGYECAERLREADITVPIIAITDRQDEEAEARCDEVGCAGILKKPLFKDELLECIRVLLQRRQVDTIVE